MGILHMAHPKVYTICYCYIHTYLNLCVSFMRTLYIQTCIIPKISCVFISYHTQITSMNIVLGHSLTLPFSPVPWPYAGPSWHHQLQGSPAEKGHGDGCRFGVHGGPRWRKDGRSHQNGVAQLKTNEIIGI